MHCIVRNSLNPNDSTVMNIDGSTIYIYDYIVSDKYRDDDPAVTATEFVNELRNMSGDITVRINSKGGEVGSALAIYQQLREHKGKVSCVVDGYAYSCAAWILLAGEERTINTGGLIMIHNPSMVVIVDSENTLNEVMPQWKAHRDAINMIISERTGLKPDKVTEMMNATTYMTSKQAIDNKFCTGMRNTVANVPTNVRNALPEDLKSTVPVASVVNQLRLNTLRVQSKMI